MSCVRVEIWNISVVSIISLLILSALNPALNVLNSALEDSGISAKLGYLISSLFFLTTIPASLSVPLLRRYLGYKSLIVATTFLHSGLYVGMIVLKEYAVMVGVVITGLADGVVQVVCQDYVTSISRIENIERNLSYFLLVTNLSGVVGSVINIACLDDSGSLDTTTRIRIYGTCVGVTVLASLLGLFLLRRIIAQPVTEEYSVSSRLVDSFRSIEMTDRRSFRVRLACLCREPAALDLLLTNAVVGLLFSYTISFVTAVNNTYHDVSLIPKVGLISGVFTVVASASFYKMVQVFSYRTMVHLFTWLNYVWLFLLLAVFPGDSFQSEFISQAPIVPAGNWVVYVIALLSGLSITYTLVLSIVTVGRIAGCNQVMHGMKPDVAFALQNVVFSCSFAVFNAITPYVSLYVLVLITFGGLLVQYYCYLNNLLHYMNN